jgi:hypothetical protein
LVAALLLLLVKLKTKTMKRTTTMTTTTTLLLHGRRTHLHLCPRSALSLLLLELTASPGSSLPLRAAPSWPSAEPGHPQRFSTLGQRARPHTWKDRQDKTDV